MTVQSRQDAASPVSARLAGDAGGAAAAAGQEPPPMTVSLIDTSRWERPQALSWGRGHVQESWVSFHQLMSNPPVTA